MPKVATPLVPPSMIVGHAHVDADLVGLHAEVAEAGGHVAVQVDQARA